MSSIRIVNVTTNEQWEQIRPLAKELMLFEKSIRPERKDTYSENNFTFLKDNVANKNGISLLALNDTDEAVGFLTAWVESSDGLNKGHPKLGEIGDVFVVPDYRQQGIFKSLLKHAILHFKELGLDRLSLWTLSTNTGMQAAVETIGFKPHKVIYELPIES